MSKGVAVALKASEIKELIKQRWRNRHIKTRPLFIVGHRGVGKTDIVRQVAAELSKEAKLDVQCRTTNLQFFEPPDFLGQYMIVKDEETGDAVSTHARPLVLPTTGYGIWFLDEGNRCHRDMRSGLLTILQDRRVNNIPIGPGWLIVVAGNPMEADGVSYEVQEFDSALEDRVTLVDFRGDFGEFVKYMIDKYGDQEPVVRWIMNQNEVVDFKGKIRTSPRSLEYLVLAVQASGGYDAPGIFNVIAAEIGMEGASTFMKFMSSAENISADEVLDAYGPTTEEKLKELEKKHRNDILNSLITGLYINLTNRKEITDKNLENVMRCLEVVDAEFRAAFFLSWHEYVEKANKEDRFERAVDYFGAHSPAIVKFLRTYDPHKIEEEKKKATTAEEKKKEEK